MIVASEVGVMDFEPGDVVQKGRLQPGKILLIDTAEGKIYYDGRDIDSLDKRELRKKFGVVLQEGGLISGSIYENITITAPSARLKRVKEVVREVGLEEDIKAMPMGLHTVLSENSGTISGGQKQRILIARAIVGKPKIIFFDEATSALDNVTQSMVVETLEKLKATKIVIAHRLSTVVNCDRILVLEHGELVEEGSYQELMDKKGRFYELAIRQILYMKGRRMGTIKVKDYISYFEKIQYTELFDEEVHRRLKNIEAVYGDLETEETIQEILLSREEKSCDYSIKVLTGKESVKDYWYELDYAAYESTDIGSCYFIDASLLKPGADCSPFYEEILPKFSGEMRSKKLLPMLEKCVALLDGRSDYVFQLGAMTGRGQASSLR